MKCTLCQSDDVKELMVLKRGATVWCCYSCEYAFLTPDVPTNASALKLARKQKSSNGIFAALFNRLRARRNIPLSVIELYNRISHLLPTNPVILEAGAHLGYDTFGMSKMWRSATIHAFEPIPSIYNGLIERVGSCKNVKPHNVALGDQMQRVTMFISGGQSSGSSSILQPTGHLEVFPDVSFENTVDVSVVTLSDWSKANNVNQIDLMWLDMQGYEVNALKGAGSLLDHVSVIYTELCSTELYQGLTTREAYIDFLDSKGFHLLFISSPDEVIGDGIFVNKSLLSN